MDEDSPEFENYQQEQHERLWGEYADARDYLTNQDCEDFDWEDEEDYDD